MKQIDEFHIGFWGSEYLAKYGEEIEFLIRKLKENKHAIKYEYKSAKFFLKFAYQLAFEGHEILRGSRISNIAGALIEVPYCLASCISYWLKAIQCKAKLILIRMRH